MIVAEHALTSPLIYEVLPREESIEDYRSFRMETMSLIIVIFLARFRRHTMPMS